MIIHNGGSGKPVPIGNTRRGKAAPLKERKIIPLCRYAGMMLLPIANGQAKDCPPKPNGNLPPVADLKIVYIVGEMKMLMQENQNAIHGRGNSLLKTI